MQPPDRTIIHYEDPDFELIPPRDVNELEQTPYGDYRLSPTVICHKALHCRPIRGEILWKTLKFIKENTTIPVPKLYGSYTVGPITPPNPFTYFGRGFKEYVTYTFLEDIEGDRVVDIWKDMDEDTKLVLSKEVIGFAKQLHDLGEGSYVGSLERGPVGARVFFESTAHQGPFETVDEFHRKLAESLHLWAQTDARKEAMIADLSTVGSEIRFCHGKLKNHNLICKDGHLVGIVGWQLAGWYPSYWEYFIATRPDELLPARRAQDFYRVGREPPCAFALTYPEPPQIPRSVFDSLTVESDVNL